MIPQLKRKGIKMRYNLSVLFLILLPFMVFAQKGKMVGHISDVKTGEPLVGANVIIEGTMLGAATDIDGNFLFINLDPGIYKVKVLYLGYQDVLYENIRISTNLTTQANFELEEAALTTETIVVIADRPLINKNITNSNTIVKSDEIENLPVRGINNVVAMQAGIVKQRVGGADNLYVRGSRMDGVAYYVDGVLVNNPVYGNAQTEVITGAIEEIQFQAGGYSAEFGGANGGIISTTSKTGREDYNINAEIITDNFIGVGEKYMGGYSYGQTEVIFTVGGPVIPNNKNLRFFLALNNDFERSPQAFYQGMDFKNVVDPATPADTFDIYYPDGYSPYEHSDTKNIQGNITWNLNPFTIRINGNYKYQTNKVTYGSLFTEYTQRDYRYYRSASRSGTREQDALSLSLKATHVLGTKAFYDININYFDDFYVTMDPIFKHNIAAYGDSIQNAAEGTTLLRDGGHLPTLNAYSWTFDRDVRPFDYYRKQSTKSLGGKINFFYQFNKYNELKWGGEITRYTVRRYQLSPFDMASLQKSVSDGSLTDIYNRLDNYGYDVFGNATESGLNAPKHPIFGGAFIQDKLEFEDLIINAGIRLDYFDTDSKEFINPNNIEFNEQDEIDESTMKDSEPFLKLSPRLGFSFPVTEKTIFHAQYGKFYQQSRLRDVYLGANRTADDIKGGYAIQTPVGYGLTPERTTSYELGFKQQFGENFALDVTLFYKDIKDQIQQRSIFAEDGAAHRQYYAWTNGDFSTIKGLEFKMDLRRIKRFQASFDYTYSSADGTGSNPSSGFRTIWQSPTANPFFPQQISSLDFNQKHRGSVNVDYRFGREDGPTILGSKIFERFGANVLVTFNSGHNYTRWKGYGNTRTPLEALNSSTTPWYYQFDLRIDKSFAVGPVDVTAFVTIENLFNKKNVIDVFNTSGDPYDDGYLADELGMSVAEGYAQYGEQYANQFRDVYRAMTYNFDHFGPPRQIKLGLRLNL